MNLGTTAFSFTNEWLARQLTLRQLLERVGQLGARPGHRAGRLPDVAWLSEPDAGTRCSSSGASPTSSGSSRRRSARTSIWRRPTRSDDARGGRRASRRRSRPRRRSASRCCASTRHSGRRPRARWCRRPSAPASRSPPSYRADRRPRSPPSRRSSSSASGSRPRIALALDFSVSMTAVPAAFLDAVRRAGMPRGELETVVALWAAGAPTPELFAALAADRRSRRRARRGAVGFRPLRPTGARGLAAARPARRVRAREVLGAGRRPVRPTVRHRRASRVCATGRLRRRRRSEWGGSAWVDADDVDAFALVPAISAFCRAVAPSAGREASASWSNRPTTQRPRR